MPVTSRSASTSRRRAAILEAALDSFLQLGYEGTTVEEIRRRSGASTGSIYHHFGGKASLSAALYVEILGRYQEGFLTVLRRHPGAREGIEAAVRHHLRWISKNPSEARYLFYFRGSAADGGVEEAVATMNRRLVGQVREWAQPHVETGVLVDIPPDLLVSVWFGPAQEFARRWLADRTRTSLKQAAEYLARAGWGGLKADGPPATRESD